MLRDKGKTIQVWREAMGKWRETGDVSGLVEVAANMEPTFRHLFLDSILPTGLRHDLESLLRRRAVRVVRHRTAA